MANPYGPYSTSNLLGANFELTYPPEGTDPYQAGPPFALGQSALGTDNTTWVFVQATTPLTTAANNVLVNANFGASAAAGNYTAAVAVPINNFAWVRRSVTPPL